MKKIISILVALGLVLSLTVMATPVSANVTKANVVVTPPCASAPAAYNITFNTTASLTEGVHCICIKFPTGTVIPTPVPDGAITVNGNSVFGSEVTVTGTEVCFLVPVHYAAGPLVVIFNNIPAPNAWAVVNPPAAGTYTLDVWTCRAPDDTPVTSNTYDISPAISVYDFTFDFSPTYPGLPLGFVPPMKACGQNGTGQYYDTVYNASVGWLDQFILNFGTVGIPGCDTPCTNVTVSMALVSAPAGSTVTISLNGTWYSLALPDPPNTSSAVLGVIPLTVALSVFWDGLIHVDSVGDYVICFYAECNQPPPCQDPEGTIAEECMEFHAYQWKDAYPIDLYRKWNLISLPIVPFDTNIDTLLLGCNCSALIDSIWHYDRCSDTWATYPAGGLNDMYDGKSYWVKVEYSHTDPAKAPGLYVGVLWIWGVAAPMPPDSPSAYAVCEGWNMVGFRSLINLANDAYLWNFWPEGPAPANAEYGPIYGWNAMAQGWFVLTPGPAVPDEMWPTEGYWVPFEVDGTIYP